MEAAAIIGDDANPRATSPGFDFNSNEIQSIIKAFEDPSEIRHHGNQIAGTKYFTRKSSDRSIYGKDGHRGIAIAKTLHNIVIGVYDNKLPPGEANSVIEGFADYLRLVGE